MFAECLHSHLDKYAQSSLWHSLSTWELVTCTHSASALRNVLSVLSIIADGRLAGKPCNKCATLIYFAEEDWGSLL